MMQFSNFTYLSTNILVSVSLWSKCQLYASAHFSKFRFISKSKVIHVLRLTNSVCIVIVEITNKLSFLFPQNCIKAFILSLKTD